MKHGVKHVTGFNRHQIWPGKENLKYLCPPDGPPADLEARPSPPITTPFLDPLFIPPVKQPEMNPKDPTKPLDPGQLAPPPVPELHQLYESFEPQLAYVLREQEFLWQFHSEYGKKTWTWGFDGTTPGPTFHARYGQPILVRRVNDLEPLWVSRVQFALPSTTTHNHNAHTASESDGEPSDWIGTGDFWDHHYANFPASLPDPNYHKDPTKRIYPASEKLSTLWYHDHRMDFTAANVYAGLVGFYLLFDEEGSGQDEGDETTGWGLPSGAYDIPLILHDLLFDQDHQLVYDGWNTHGVLGDRFTVNRVIQPHLRVERRKYRFRILNGGPSRFYKLYLHFGEHKVPVPCGDSGHHAAEHGSHGEAADPLMCVGQYDDLEDANRERDIRFIMICGDGNFMPEPIEGRSILLGVAQRVDVIIDFSRFREGDCIYLENRMDQHHGMGPSGRELTDPEEIRSHRLMRFDVVAGEVDDPSRIPAFFREYPEVDPALAADRRREWVFDYDGGLFTINDRPMDPDRIDAVIKQDCPEIWTFRNNGVAWWHPIHSHLMEWMVLEVNGVPVLPTMVQISENPKGAQHFQKVFQDDYTNPPQGNYIPGQESHILKGPFCGGIRRDIANLGPRTELKLLSRWPDFLGKYIIHCHNVVHEDYAMMTRWEVVPADCPIAFTKDPMSVEDVYPGTEMLPPHIEVRPAHAMHSHASRPFNPKTKRPGFEPSEKCAQDDGAGLGGGHH